MTPTGTIAILDDDSAVRDSLDALLLAAGHETRCFASATEFRNDCDREEISCLLLDVRLPDADGLDVFQQLIADGFARSVIIMTGHGDVPMAVKAMRLGAWDFLEKPFEPDSLLETVQAALGAGESRSKELAEAHQAQDRLSRLTSRETEVMKKLVLGRPNKVIAGELGLSPRTVEIHRARVMEKTEAQSLSHLVRMAIAAGVDAELERSD